MAFSAKPASVAELGVGDGAQPDDGPADPGRVHSDPLGGLGERPALGIGDRFRYGGDVPFRESPEFGH